MRNWIGREMANKRWEISFQHFPSSILRRLWQLIQFLLWVLSTLFWMAPTDSMGAQLAKATIQPKPSRGVSQPICRIRKYHAQWPGMTKRWDGKWVRWVGCVCHPPLVVYWRRWMRTGISPRSVLNWEWKIKSECGFELRRKSGGTTSVSIKKWARETDTDEWWEEDGDRLLCYYSSFLQFNSISFQEMTRISVSGCMNGRQTIQNCGHVCLCCSLCDGQLLCTEEYHDDDDVKEAEECYVWWRLLWLFWEPVGWRYKVYFIY